jgi:hypothetical protein
MVVVLTSVPVSAQSPAPLLSQLFPAESIDAVIAFGFSRHDALRALNHVGGSANLAVNYLLDQPHSPPPTVAVEAKQKQSLERRRDSTLKQFFWGPQFSELELAFVESSSQSKQLRYSRFVDCFTGTSCIKLRKKEAFWNHVCPLHHLTYTLDVFRQRINLHNWKLRCVPPVPVW